MREIKFRVWDGERYLDQDIAISSKGRVIDIEECMWNYESENSVVQQYTGLKDKNGVEIYEGDIVKLVDLNYKVFWDEWKWNASCPYYHQRHYPQFGDRFFSNARCSEVIGNIHEDRDLLK